MAISMRWSVQRAVLAVATLAITPTAAQGNCPAVSGLQYAYPQNIIIQPVEINEYFNYNTTINVGGITININNAPTSISTVVTATSTVITSVTTPQSNTTSSSVPASSRGAVDSGSTGGVSSRISTVSTTSPSSSPTTTTVATSSTSSLPAALTVPIPIDQVALATSFISADGYQSFCSSYLGYIQAEDSITITSYGTVSVTAIAGSGVVSANSTTTITETVTTPLATVIDVIISIETSITTILDTETIRTTTISVTPLAKRQDTSAEAAGVPSPLQTFSPEVLSSACSLEATAPLDTITVTIPATGYVNTTFFSYAPSATVTAVYSSTTTITVAGSNTTTTTTVAASTAIITTSSTTTETETSTISCTPTSFIISATNSGRRPNSYIATSVAPSAKALTALVFTTDVVSAATFEMGVCDDRLILPGTGYVASALNPWGELPVTLVFTDHPPNGLTPISCTLGGDDKLSCSLFRATFIDSCGAEVCITYSDQGNPDSNYTLTAIPTTLFFNLYALSSDATVNGTLLLDSGFIVVGSAGPSPLFTITASGGLFDASGNVIYINTNPFDKRAREKRYFGIIGSLMYADPNPPIGLSATFSLQGTRLSLSVPSIGDAVIVECSSVPIPRSLLLAHSNNIPGGCSVVTLVVQPHHL